MESYVSLLCFDLGKGFVTCPCENFLSPSGGKIFSTLNLSATTLSVFCLLRGRDAFSFPLGQGTLHTFLLPQQQAVDRPCHSAESEG